MRDWQTILRRPQQIGNKPSTGSRTIRRALAFESLEDRRMLANVPTGFTDSIVADNLTSPVTMTIADDGRIFLAYQDGRIGVLENDQLNANVFALLDTDGSGERGLQGIELDPDFDTNGYVYVYYTAASPASHNRVSRLTVDPTTGNSMLAGSELVLLDLPNLSTVGNPIWHMGGALHFLPDGTIAVQVGDHQDTSKPQNLESPFGKILRINTDGTAATDNPYYNAGDGISFRDYIWSAGLRNPFSGDVDPDTGRYFVNDVGQGSWEEINEATLTGQNFGWPTTEGSFDGNTYPGFTQPVHAYSHADGCAITGGAFNSPTVDQFPSEYHGKYFFSEFCRGEIRIIDPDNGSSSTDFATAASFPMNIEIAPDGSLYYIARGAGAGGAPGIGTGEVRKIQYIANVPPTVSFDPQDALASVGYDATFSASAFGTAPLEYQWQRRNGASGVFVDISGATSETYVLANAQIEDNGAQFRVRVSNGFGSDTSAAATLTVTTDTPPTAIINLPTSGLTYVGGQTFDFSGVGSDLEDGNLAAANLTWTVDFHHNVHSHPFFPATSGISSGQFTIPNTGETSPNVWYRVHLSVVDSAGLMDSTFVDIFPELSNFTVTTNLGSGQVLVDGSAKSAPYSVTGVVGVERSLEAPPSQVIAGTAYLFTEWDDGFAGRIRTIATPDSDTTYTAIYGTTSLTFLSELDPVGTPLNGLGPIEKDSSNGGGALGDGVPITLDSVQYKRGLGVYAGSDLTFNLGGQYQRFQSDIGLDDELSGGSVVFQVYGDGNLLFDSGALTDASPTLTIDLDVTDINLIRVVVTDAGDGNAGDSAVWADARLLKSVTGSDLRINFQTDTSLTPNGYLADVGLVFANRGNGFSYGWSADHTDVSRDRNLNSDQRYDTLLHFHQSQQWEIELPEGAYVVTVAVGDAGFDSTHTLNVEGVSFYLAEPTAANEFRKSSQIVLVSDGRLTIDQGTAADKATRLDFIEIVPTEAAVPPPFILGDVNLDGVVNMEDVSDFIAGWRTNTSTLSDEDKIRAGDLNRDGITDFGDWWILHEVLAQDPVLASLDLSTVLAATRGDFNADGATNSTDLNAWSQNYGLPPAASPAVGDANLDGAINGLDFLAWQRNITTETVASASAVQVEESPLLALEPLDFEAFHTTTSAEAVYLASATEVLDDSSKLNEQTEPCALDEVFHRDELESKQKASRSRRTPWSLPASGLMDGEKLHLLHGGKQDRHRDPTLSLTQDLVFHQWRLLHWKSG